MGGRHDPALLLVLGHVGLLLVHTRSLAAPGREAFPGEITAGLFAHLASLAPKSKRVNDEQSPNREHASEAAGGGRQRRALGAHVNNPVKHDFLLALGLGRERVNDERGRHLLSPLDPSPKALASLGFALPAQAPASAAFCDPTSK